MSAQGVPASTWYDGLFEELFSEVGQEAVDALPGDLPEVGVAGSGVGAVEDAGCVHHKQHVLQGLCYCLQLGGGRKKVNIHSHGKTW